MMRKSISLILIVLTFANGQSALSKVSIQKITPDPMCIAGQPIHFSIRVYDTNGLISGPYCVDNSICQYSISNPKLNFKNENESLVLNGVTANVKDTFMAENCFLNGIDTVLFILNHSSFSNSVRISIGNYSDSVAFPILPSFLGKIRIVNEHLEKLSNVSLKDTDTLPLIYCLGYDMFDNIRGFETANWAQLNPTLDITRNNTIRFEAKIIERTSNCITAYALSDTRVKDSLSVQFSDNTKTEWTNNIRTRQNIKWHSYYDLQGRVLQKESGKRTKFRWSNGSGRPIIKVSY